MLWIFVTAVFGPLFSKKENKEKTGDEEVPSPKKEKSRLGLLLSPKSKKPKRSRVACTNADARPSYAHASHFLRACVRACPRAQTLTRVS